MTSSICKKYIMYVFGALVLLVSTIIIAGCSAKRVDNPFTKINNRRIVSKYHDTFVKPNVLALEDFQKQVNEYNKKNKDVNLRNKKRVELAKLALVRIQTVNPITDSAMQNDNILLDYNNSAIKYSKSIKSYLENNWHLLDSNKKTRTKWEKITTSYRDMFDSNLEYENYRSIANKKGPSYDVNAKPLRWLKKGHNYIHFGNAFHMPGKLLSKEVITVNGKRVYQENYLWSHNEAVVVVTFHNGMAVNIKAENVW